MLNEDSKKKGECGESTERKCKTDVELVCAVCERCGAISVIFMHAVKGGSLGKQKADDFM